MLGPGLPAAEGLRCKGDYFLYNDDIDYLFGRGNIILTTDPGTLEITGDVLYLKVADVTGVLYGNVRVRRGVDSAPPKGLPLEIKEESYDAVFFNGIPPQWLMVSYKDEMVLSGDLQLKPFFLYFDKKTPEELKDSSLYFEFREFYINQGRQIKAKTVIPYMMGLPTLPLKRFTVRRGAWSEKTLLSFKNINYSALDGLSTVFYFRLRGKLIDGDHDIKLYERKLFGLEGPKRGILLSGKNAFLAKKKELLGISSLWNSGEESYNIQLSHRMDFKLLSYGFSQVFSGQKDRSSFTEFSSELTLKPFKVIIPRFQFSYDLKKSYSYRFSSPLNLVKKLNLQFNWQRRIIRDIYRSDTIDFSTALNFNTSVFSLSSNYNFSKNLIEASVRENFSVNMNLTPWRLLMNNISLGISGFCMVSSLPYGGETRSRFSPGFNITLNSAGALMPLGFKLVPTFSFNHLWDNQAESFTDFNYGLSLQKEIGKFRGAVDYSLASRYRARNFWIEGSQRQNMNLNLQVSDPKSYSFLLRFYFNNELVLENSSFTGQLSLFHDWSLSSFVLYYNREKKFQTLEMFIEKIFKKSIKIQGGYSLALKRFFVKFLTL